jgi:quercetin dioxygenase-like cupin family protein
MTESNQSKPTPQGKMAIFTAAAAPTLEEAGMMDAMSFTVEGANEAPTSEVDQERMHSGAHLTVPFRQEGPGGFSLVTVDFAPGYLLPRHSHSSDCLYYIIEGGIVMGRRELGPGDGFFLPADQPYAYHAGPDGVKLLEFRHEAAFDMKVYEEDMSRFAAKAMSSMDAAQGERAAVD